jgi:hypothetical protein
VTDGPGGTGGAQPPSDWGWSTPGAPPPPTWPGAPPPPTWPGAPPPPTWPGAPPSYESWQPSWPPPGPAGPPPGWGQGWPDRPRTTNVWAIVALVTGIVALVPVAIGAAITAFVQIHRRHQTGLGMAIAGIVLAAVWTVVGIGVGIGFVLNQTTVNGALGRVADTEVATVGSCLQEPRAQDSVATGIDCAQDHDAEVYLVDDLGAGVWPGYDAVDANADATCYDAFEGYVGSS